MFTKDQSKAWNDQLINYFEINGIDPLDMSNNMFESYWSKPEVEARHHPNMIFLQKSLMTVWNKKPGIGKVYQ